MKKCEIYRKIYRYTPIYRTSIYQYFRYIDIPLPSLVWGPFVDFLWRTDQWRKTFEVPLVHRKNKKHSREYKYGYLKLVFGKFTDFWYCIMTELLIKFTDSMEILWTKFWKTSSKFRIQIIKFSRNVLVKFESSERES